MPLPDGVDAPGIYLFHGLGEPFPRMGDFAFLQNKLRIFELVKRQGEIWEIILMKDKLDPAGWFKIVFESNFEYIRNYLYYLSGDVDLAEDLAQDVFLRLWEKRAELKDGMLRPYLFTIARNRFLKNRRRRQYDLKFRSALLEESDQENPHYKLEMKEYDKRLQKVIADLPEKSRTVFLMSRIDGLTYREIAKNLRVSDKAIEKQMSKALAILRKAMGGNF